MSDDLRLNQLKHWLTNELHIENFDLAPASADASFRRYFRITTAQQSWVAMDAPPDKEDCEPFVHVAQMIESAGVQAPHIYERNKDDGFMLLSDLGSSQYLATLSSDSAETLYQDAIDALIKMQQLENGLPAYDRKLLQTEMHLFRDWYLGTHLNIKLSPQQNDILQSAFDLLIQNALQQPQVFVHRDYHSRNLMLTANDNPGVIDFQDAVIGPISYDLVSLLKDCYIAWPRKKITSWIKYFLDNNPLTRETSVEQFTHWFELMGVQRHLKAIGIFARLNHRDGKPGYLNDIPRTLTYVIDSCRRYPELTAFSALLDELGLRTDDSTLDLIQ
ncbi:MAG: phosphotransferase [Gammaproteobacteria bacterium]|nr:phosphotransferase [Gammaproteobacteria bacterium]